MQVTSAPEIHGTRSDWRDGRYRLYTCEHVDFDTFPPYNEGGPAKVVIDGWGMSTETIDPLFSSRSVVAAHDGLHELHLSQARYDEDGAITGFDKHELDGTRWATRRDAERAAFNAGTTAFMVYERDAAKWGLSTAA